MGENLQGVSQTGGDLCRPDLIHPEIVVETDQSQRGCREDHDRDDDSAEPVHKSRVTYPMPPRLARMMEHLQGFG
jgi:hypothetical protein